MREDFVRRLALIRHLYRLGVVQSRLPAPLSAISILIFHDGVELFLQLASEALDAETKSKMEFMDYWGPISKKLPGGELGMNEAMRRLNKARVGFKPSISALSGRIPACLKPTRALFSLLMASFIPSSPPGSFLLIGPQ